jgi:hypothetical protein
MIGEVRLDVLTDKAQMPQLDEAANPSSPQ